MRKFIKNIGYFLIILLTINIILYFTGRELYFGHYEIHSLNQKSYLLSDSHGQALLDYTEKYGVHNFSYGSDSYDDMYRKTLYLIRNTGVDTIYISVDEHSLTSYREKKNNLDRSVIYCSPDDFSSYYEYFKQKYIKHYLAIFRPEIAEVIKIYKLPSDKKPVSWASRNPEDKNNRAEKRVRTNFPVGGEAETLIQALKNIILACKSNKIELTGVKFPLSKEYLIAAEGKSGSADELLLENGFQVIDCTRIYLDMPEYFADQDHLNEAGAANFTERIFGRKLNSQFGEKSVE
jgi:hypothetical protein